MTEWILQFCRDQTFDIRFTGTPGSLEHESQEKKKHSCIFGRHSTYVGRPNEPQITVFEFVQLW